MAASASIQYYKDEAKKRQEKAGKEYGRGQEKDTQKIGEAIKHSGEATQQAVKDFK